MNQQVKAGLFLVLIFGVCLTSIYGQPQNLTGEVEGKAHVVVRSAQADPVTTPAPGAPTVKTYAAEDDDALGLRPRK